MAEDRVLAVEDGDVMCSFTLAPGQQWLLVQAKAGDGNKPGRHRGKIILHPGDTLKVVYGK